MALALASGSRVEETLPTTWKRYYEATYAHVNAINAMSPQLVLCHSVKIMTTKIVDKLERRI